MNKENIFSDILINKSKEEFKDILKNDNIRIERIVSNGQTSKKEFWYTQEENEFILLLQGDAILEFEDKEIELKQGDYLEVKAKVKHRVKYTNIDKPTIWLAIFY